MNGTTECLAFVASRTDEGENLRSYRLDPETGALRELDSAVVGTSPSYLTLHPDGETLYVVDSTDDGEIVAVSFEEASGELSVLNRQPTGDAGPCYCSVDAAGTHVFVAHYHGGSVSMLPVETDDRLGEPTHIVPHEGDSVDPDRQTHPHPHSIRPGPDGRFAYAPDLGTDEVAIYEIDRDAGKLRPAESASVSVHPGAGPRHLDFHPDERRCYLINEIDSTVIEFERDPQTGALTEIGTVETLPTDFAGENKTADIHVHPSGRFVYGSNRGHDSIVAFEIGEDIGQLTLRDHVSTRGEWPRNFVLDPTGEYLFAANLHTDEVVSFEIDPETGIPTPTGDVTDCPAPMCIKPLAVGDGSD